MLLGLRKKPSVAGAPPLNSKPFSGIGIEKVPDAVESKSKNARMTI